eukprot:scaffold2630_cov350-Pavlova_lutheri.AAC.16
MFNKLGRKESPLRKSWWALVEVHTSFGLELCAKVVSEHVNGTIKRKTSTFHLTALQRRAPNGPWSFEESKPSYRARGVRFEAGVLVEKDASSDVESRPSNDTSLGRMLMESRTECPSKRMPHGAVLPLFRFILSYVSIRFPISIRTSLLNEGLLPS